MFFYFLYVLLCYVCKKNSSWWISCVNKIGETLLFIVLKDLNVTKFQLAVKIKVSLLPMHPTKTIPKKKKLKKKTVPFPPHSSLSLSPSRYINSTDKCQPCTCNLPTRILHIDNYPSRHDIHKSITFLFQFIIVIFTDENWQLFTFYMYFLACYT